MQMTIVWWVEFYFRGKWLYVLCTYARLLAEPKPMAIPPSVCKDQMALAMRTSAAPPPSVWESICGVSDYEWPDVARNAVARLSHKTRPRIAKIPIKTAIFLLALRGLDVLVEVSAWNSVFIFSSA